MVVQGVLGAVFSDIDGTLVHYKDKLEHHLGYKYQGKTDRVFNGLPIHEWKHESSGDAVIETVAVPSATLGGGFCSVKTIQLVKELRAQGVLFCVLTGARTSTFIERRDSGSIPEADYCVCEGGGRLWGPSGELDEAWADQFAAVTGPWRNQLDGPCDQKQGPLWDCYRRLAETDVLGSGTGKVKLDGKSFATAFMADVRGDTTVSPTLGMATVSDKEEALRRLMEQELTPKYHVAMVVNLGKAHVGPVGLDKSSAVEHIARLAGVRLHGRPVDPSLASSSRYAAALFDDENDLTFAELCSVGFAPSIAHPSVVPHMEKLGSNFVRAPIEGFLGTEFAVEQLLAMRSAASTVA